MNVLDQTIEVTRGEDAVIPFSGGGDVTGWAIGFGVSTGDAAAVLSGYPLSVGAGITVTDAAAGLFRVAVPAAMTLALAAGGRYRFGLWRTDSGARRPLAGGWLVVRDVASRPA